jgi:hypothetical protein
MKKINKIAIALILSLAVSCVQKTKKQTIILNLDVSKIKNIKTVGVRGEEQPLS